MNEVFIMGMFAGVANAKMSEAQPPLTDGKFRVKFQRCIAKKLFKGGNAFIAEFTIVQSSDLVKHPVGALRGWVQKMEPAEIALGSLKAFGSAVLGVDPRDNAKVEAEIVPILEKSLDAAVSPTENAFGGLEVDVQVDTIQTKPTAKDPQGHPFTKHAWIPIPAAA
jgi:hypothetical protein